MNQRTLMAVMAFLVWTGWLGRVSLYANRPIKDAQAVQAEYVVTFAKYIEWPNPTKQGNPTVPNPLIIGIFGPDPFERKFDQLTSPEQEIRIIHSDNPYELQPAHFIYIHHSLINQWKKKLDPVLAMPVVLVSYADSLTEAAEFLQSGGMICFLEMGKRIKYTVHHGHLKQSGFVVRSPLLSSAVEVLP